MARKVICYKCAKEFLLLNEEDCWSKAEHLPFDTLQKMKKIISNNCICNACMRNLMINIED